MIEFGRDYDDVGRLQVQASHRNPVDIADQVAEYILEINDPPLLFSMSPAAVVLSNGVLVPLDPDGWLLYVARRVTFTIPLKNGTTQIIAPPAAAMKLIPPVVIPKLPPIDGIATTPYFNQDGNLIAADGYNPGTRRLLLSGDLRMPEVKAVPSEEDVAQAVNLLCEDWLGDFPFGGPADRANALAVLLTMTGRMFYNLVPLTVYDASTRRLGQGPPGHHDKHHRHRHAAQCPGASRGRGGTAQKDHLGRPGRPGTDHVGESHVIAGRTLAAILTAERYSDRLLGGNKLISVTNRFTQVALGNNVTVWGDMKRRVVASRLVPDTEHPEARTDFRHADLEGWVRANRGELLAAVLTIWSNWIARGRPEAAAGMGSFERWARSVGGALATAGIAGFRANTSEWLSFSEDDDGGWTSHLAQLRKRHGDMWFTVSAVADAVEAGLLKRPPVKGDSGKTLALQLAYAYRGLRDKWHGDLCLARSAQRDSESGGYTWTVRQRLSHPGAGLASSVSPDVQYEAEHPEHPEDAKPAPQPSEVHCTECGEELDPALVELGYTTHGEEAW